MWKIDEVDWALIFAFLKKAAVLAHLAAIAGQFVRS
jgi:hypothetical protein